MTIPVFQKGHFGQNISETRISEDKKWKKKILGSLQANYSRAPFFQKYYKSVETLLLQELDRLAEVNISVLKWAAGELGIDIPTIRSSEIEGIEGVSSQRLVSICRKFGGSRYFSGFGGLKYQEEKLFQDFGIELIISDFKHPKYPQLWGEFMPNLSIFDLLFNCGPDSGRILLGK